MLRAHVTPSFTQDHSDVTDVPQTQACAINPEGFATLGARKAGHPDTLIILRGKWVTKSLMALSSTVFQVRAIAKTKPQRRAGSSASRCMDHLHILLRAIGGVALHNHPLGPQRWHKASHHLTEQRIFRAILRMGFRSNQAKGHRQAIAVPRDDQQREADPAKPGLMLAFATFLGQGMLHPSLGFDTAIPHQRERPVLGRRQGVEGFLQPPLDQQMDIPIGRLQHTAQAPSRDLSPASNGRVRPRFTPGKQGMHEDEPTQHEPVTIFPDARHPTKQER